MESKRFRTDQPAWYDSRNPTEYHYVASCPRFLEILPGDRYESTYREISASRLPSCDQCFGLQLELDILHHFSDIEDAEGFDALEPGIQAEVKALSNRHRARIVQSADTSATHQQQDSGPQKTPSVRAKRFLENHLTKQLAGHTARELITQLLSRILG